MNNNYTLYTGKFFLLENIHDYLTKGMIYDTLYTEMGFSPV